MAIAVVIGLEKLLVFRQTNAIHSDEPLKANISSSRWSRFSSALRNRA